MPTGDGSGWKAQPGKGAPFSYPCRPGKRLQGRERRDGAREGIYKKAACVTGRFSLRWLLFRSAHLDVEARFPVAVEVAPLTRYQGQLPSRGGILRDHHCEGNSWLQVSLRLEVCPACR